MAFRFEARTESARRPDLYDERREFDLERPLPETFLARLFLALPGDSGAVRSAGALLGNRDRDIAEKCGRNGNGPGKRVWKCRRIRWTLFGGMAEQQIPQ